MSIILVYMDILIVMCRVCIIELFVASLSFMYSLSYVNHPCVYVYIDCSEGERV